MSFSIHHLQYQVTIYYSCYLFLANKSTLINDIIVANNNVNTGEYIDYFLTK